ncbi:porin [Achromobacter sp. GG226]|uniref:porin n=1 Tax=Verticiella alkaliphila TaxID=2779529 RepID=UPI001C0AEF6B|nr:porin [Verticiella sp. GG226]MBU4609605.1 porin [Verticiella sp. GG226]
MYKKIPSLAALCLLSAAAQAQSSVTLYGVVDVAVGHTSESSGVDVPGGTRVLASRQSATRMDSGVSAGSRFGLRGVEDLGGGLQAKFQLESGFNVNNGASTQGGLLFGRMAYVGLAGKHWSLTGGRQLTPMNNAAVASMALPGGYWGAISGAVTGSYEPVGATPGGGAFQTGTRADNSVLFTYTLGPVTANTMVAGGNQNSQGTGRYGAFVLGYADGPLKLNAGVSRMRQNREQVIDPDRAEWQTTWLLGGSYDFGVATLYTGFSQFNPRKDTSNLSPVATVGAAGASVNAFTWERSRIAWVGAKIPLAGGNLLAQVSRHTYKYQDNDDGRSTTLGVAYDYPLSKRTAVYASYGQVSNNDRARTPLFSAIPAVSPFGYGSDLRGVSVGMRHTF